MTFRTLVTVTLLIYLLLLGGSSAIAQETSLCKSNEEGALTCSAANRVTELHAVAKSPTFLSSYGNVTCTESLLKAEVLAPNATQVAHLKELTWTGCKREGTENCSVKTVLTGLLEFTKSASNLAAVASKGTAWEVECGFFIDCAYDLPTLHGLGASLPTHAGLLSAKEVALVANGAHSDVCPPTAKWDATYEFLEDVYVTS